MDIEDIWAELELQRLEDSLINDLQAFDPNRKDTVDYVTNPMITCIVCKESFCIVHDSEGATCTNCATHWTGSVTNQVTEEDFWKNYDKGWEKQLSKGYIRAKYFVPCFNRALGRERTDIPMEAITLIARLCPHPPSWYDVRKACNTLGGVYKKKYFVHAQSIINDILRVPAPRFDERIENMLFNLHAQFLEGYDYLKINKKKFLPFGFIMLRALEMIEEKYKVELKYEKTYFHDVKQEKTRARNMEVFNKIKLRENQYRLDY